MIAPSREAESVRVWDLAVRVFHWSLAAAFFVAYFTEDDLLAVHVWAGYAVGGLIAFRLVWGFVGTRHARFADFLFGPFAALRYLIDLPLGRSERHLGHSPAGAWMVYVLLAGCLLVVVTGLLAYGAEGKGPLAGIATSAPALDIAASARADEDEREENEGEEFFEEVHEVLSEIVMILVILHILGVILASVAHRENLTRAMWTGRKRPLSNSG